MQRMLDGIPIQKPIRATHAKPQPRAAIQMSRKGMQTEIYS